MPQERTPRRIVVALDTGSLFGAAIDAAARLAIGLQGNLRALFIEDANLRRLAGLPFARELGNTSAQSRRFDLAEFDRAFAVQARQVRRVLEAAVQGLSQPWSFEVVPGRLIAVALQHTPGADVLVLGRMPRAAYRGARAVAGMRRMERRVAPRHPIVALYDGSEGASGVLEAAFALERRAHANVVVAIPAAGPGQFAERRALAEAVLAARGRAAGGYLCLPDATIATVAAAVRRQRADALLVPASDLARAGDEFEGLVDEIACPIVLVR